MSDDIQKTPQGQLNACIWKFEKSLPQTQWDMLLDLCGHGSLSRFL